MSKHYQEPAFPTYPVQSQMGQVLVSFGVSKLELLTSIVYLSHGGRLAVGACIPIAAEIIDKCTAYGAEQPTETEQPKIISLK